MATVEYTSTKGRTYVIEADRHGTYTISLGGKPIKTMGLGDYYGKPRFGSKKLEAQAIEAAKNAIERFMTEEG